MSLRQSRSAEILPVVNGTPNLPTSRSISASKSRNQDSTPSVSPSPSPSPSPRRGLICVTGGSGFVGRHLIERLISLGYHVRSFDIYESWNDERVEFVMGDLRNKENVVAALDGCECVIHTASYTTSFASYQDLYDVNVTGALHVIDACIANGVEQLIYTSTSSVVIDGHDIKNGDETSLKYPKTHLDNYSATKAIAERYVLAANGQPVVSRHARKSPAILCTCSLRPHAIFGPRDTHFIAKLIDHAKVGEITHMIGDGRNIVDFTYIDNVVHAHLLAMSKLKPGSVVCGQCYFITNGEPRPFWDFVNTVLTETGCMGPTKSISFYVAYFIAYCMEMWRSIMVKLFGRIRLFQSGPYTITRHMVCTMGCHNWFSHAKATRELGYKPIVSLDEGLDITIMYFQRKASARTTMHGMMRPGSRPGTRTPHALTSAGSSSDLVLPPSVLPSRGSLTAPHSLVQSQSVGGATSHSMPHPSRPLLSPYHSTHHPLTPHSSAGALLRDIPTQPHHTMNIVRSQSSKTPREGHLHSPVHDHHHTIHDHV